jgi:adenylate kinase family enzyme
VDVRQPLPVELRPVLKINVTGSAGAGKTTYAKRFAEALDLPVFHLDSVVWQPGWKKTPAAPRAELELAMTRQPGWVIDGVSDHVRQQADLIVVLDVPRLRCLRQALRRNLPYLFRSRPGLPEKCPEILILPKLVRMIMSYPQTLKPMLFEAAAQSTNYVLLKNRSDYQAILATLREKV